MAYKAKLSKELLDACRSVTKKRAKTVIEHIIKNGQITSEDLKQLYGYDHPPRAIRDVREEGIPIITIRVDSTTKKGKIAAYVFGDPSLIMRGRFGGRKAFSKKFKERLVEAQGARDAFSHEKLDKRYLQIDHRIPYEIAGDNANDNDIGSFMLIDASSQRAKSWSCEHCPNFNPKKRDPDVCKQCFWAFPESYTHVATDQKRRVELVWSGKDVEAHDELAEHAKREAMSVSDYIKSVLASQPVAKSSD